MINELDLDTAIGPGGVPGEYKYIQILPDGNMISMLTGMHTIDTELIDWTMLPKSYKDIAVPAGYKTWLPKIVQETKQGIVFADMNEEGWFWTAMPATKNASEKWIADKTKSKDFKKFQYLDALEYIGITKA